MASQTLRPPGIFSTVQGGGNFRSVMPRDYTTERRPKLTCPHPNSLAFTCCDGLPTVTGSPDGTGEASVSRSLSRGFSIDCVPVLFSYGHMATGRQFDLPYMVEQWDDTDSHVEELIALTGDYRVARAAYEEAVKRRPGRIVTLRQKTRLLADSRSLK